MEIPWINRHATAFIVGPDIVNPEMRALVIADLHLTLALPLGRGLPLLIEKLLRVLLDNSITVLFIIGDVLEQTDKRVSEFVSPVLAAFDSLAIPVFLMPGNHDRNVYNKARLNWRFPNVTLVTDLMICLADPDPPPGAFPRIFMTHDGGNPFKIRDRHTKLYVLGLRRLFYAVIDPNDFFLTAHDHGHTRFDKKRCATISQFSIDNNVFTWALITRERRFKLTYGSCEGVSPAPWVREQDDVDEF
jgi:predicted phosphodiesterase